MNYLIQKFKSFFNKTKTFNDLDLEKEYKKNGYVVLNLLNENEIEQCLKIYQITDSNVSKEKYNTLEINEENHRQFISDELAKIIAAPILKNLREYKIFGYNFAIKKAKTKIKFDAHLDDEHADESKYECVNVWIPLVDVNEKNGALYLIKGSHKLNHPPRGIGLPFAYEKSLKFIEEASTPISLKAGQAIFFSPRMIHGSGFNKTDYDRPAIIVGLAPQNAPLYVLMTHDKIEHSFYEKFEIDERFFHKVQIGKRPDFSKSLGVYKYERKDFNEKTIKTLLK
jgi:hypothetical protein